MQLHPNATRNSVMDRSRPVLQLIDRWDDDFAFHWQGMRWDLHQDNNGWSLWATLSNGGLPMHFDDLADARQWVTDHPDSSDLPSSIW